MGSSVLYISMSLDGFVTGPDDGTDNGDFDSGDEEVPIEQRDDG